MDPVSIGLTYETLAMAAAATTAAGTGVAAVGQYQAANKQAEADRQRAAIEGQWAERRALDERVAGQQAAADETRKARYAQSRLTALAGNQAGDPTVMDLWGDIEKEGDRNAKIAQGMAEEKAGGIEYQSALDQWGAETNARIKERGATTSLIGGLLSATGQFAGGMAGRYGGPRGYRGYYS